MHALIIKKTFTVNVLALSTLNFYGTVYYMDIGHRSYKDEASIFKFVVTRPFIQLPISLICGQWFFISR